HHYSCETCFSEGLSFGDKSQLAQQKVETMVVRKTGCNADCSVTRPEPAHTLLPRPARIPPAQTAVASSPPQTPVPSCASSAASSTSAQRYYKADKPSRRRLAATRQPATAMAQQGSPTLGIARKHAVDQASETFRLSLKAHHWPQRRVPRALPAPSRSLSGATIALV